jgi:glyoxylase-like metal-dependent hydrolase (beta-lactamase superfamily II)
LRDGACAKESDGLAKIEDGVFARIVSADGDAVSNAGFVVLDGSVLVFDTHFTPEAGDALRAAIRTITSKPVRYVINSHWHADHTHGNQSFPEAQLISSVNARRDILQSDLPALNRSLRIAQTQLDRLRKTANGEPDSSERQALREQIKSREEYLRTMARLKIVAPSATLEQNLTIRDGERECRILSMGTGHTDGDIVLFLPASKVVFAGDLFFNGAIPNVQDASILEWMKTLGNLLKLDADTFLPGHGAIGSKKEVEAFLRYFEELKALVQPVVDRGDSVEQCAREIQVPAKYASYQFQNLFPSNIQKMYAELKALQLSPDPVPAAPKTDPRRLSK